jgi:LysM repeat protein
MRGDAVPPPVLQPSVPVETAPMTMEETGTHTYTVKPGDSLSRVAQKFDISTRELAELNNISNADVIFVGQELLLPTHAQNLPAAEPRKPKAPKVMPGSTYVVQSGDTLSEIAGMYDTTVQALKEVNNLTGDVIFVGQKLVLPTTARQTDSATQPKPKRPEPKPVEVAPAMALPEVVEEVPPAPEPQPAPAAPEVVADDQFTYILQEGDTLESVAKDFVVLKEDLMKANNITDPDSVRPGRKLVIPLASPGQ